MRNRMNLNRQNAHIRNPILPDLSGFRKRLQGDKPIKLIYFYITGEVGICIDCRAWMASIVWLLVFWSAYLGFWRFVCLGICELCIARLETQGHIKTDNGLERE